MSEKASTSSRKRFPLGLEEGWTDSEEDSVSETPVPKKKRLSLPLKKRSKSDAALPCATKENGPSSCRWSFLSEVEELGLAKKCVPKNTATMTEWAVTNFLAWQTSRNKEFDGDQAKQVPSTLLKSSDPSVLSKWLSLYCAEARKKDGGSYPPKTVYALLTGLLRHMRSLNPECPNFLDFSDPRFTTLQNYLDNLFRDLRARGVGSESKNAEVFSRTEDKP